MLEENIILYVPELTPRLEYIAKFIFKNVLGCKFSFTTSIQKVSETNLPVLNYSKDTIENAVQIIPHNLLFETVIKPQHITVVLQNEMPIFFENKNSFIGFDIFAASFYLLTCYQEYLPFNPDKYGRFPHTESIAFKNNFLEKPLINIWCKHLQNALLYYFPTMIFEENKFNFIPSYDIDIAYSYKHKGIKRTLGAFAKELFSLNFRDSTNRMLVLLNLKKDPFDSFNFLETVRKKYNLNPIYFFLVGDNGEYDKNIALKNTAMQNLIKNIAIANTIGIHPSYASNTSEILVKNEIKNIEKTIGQNIVCSRQHYIKYTLPETFNTLIKNNIHADYSLGFGSINGFRASTCSPHYWFNIKENRIKDLQLFPFCWMDANSFYEQNLNAKQAQNELQYYLEICKKYNGNLITILHNFSVGTEPKWNGWRETYIYLLENIN